MKKMTILAALLLAMLCVSTAWAEMGVQIIGGPAVETEPVSLDDFKLNVDVTIEGYGILNGTSFEFADRLGYYRMGETEPYWLNYYREDYYMSGNEADYAILRMDILNIATRAHDYLAAAEVKVVYDDLYEFKGWVYQSNINNTAAKTERHGNDSEKQNYRWVINSADQFAIDPMYEGHYVFGCTLPNAALKNEKSLRMEITLDGNEIIYNIRK